MKVMRSALMPKIVLTVLLLGALAGGRIALASAASLEDVLASQLVPSAPPALLAPITSAGRVGWACKPEKMAAATAWRDADLPPSTDQH